MIPSLLKNKYYISYACKDDQIQPSLYLLQDEAKEKYIALAAQLKEKHGVKEWAEIF